MTNLQNDLLILFTYSLPALLPGIMFNDEAINITNSYSTVKIRFLKKYLALLDSLF